MKNLSLVMITKNEELKIKRCLESVRDIVEEIIIVDTGSTDNTKNIALEFGAKIYDYKWDNNFSNARNYALKQSKSDWNLILDADEYITDINLKSLKKFMSSNTNVVGKVKIVNLFDQDNEIRKSQSFISRLSPKGTYFEGSIHEQLDTNYPREIVDITLEHDGYLHTNKFERNIDMILRELDENTEDSYLLYQAAKTYYSNEMYVEASSYFDKFYKVLDLKTDAFAKDGIVLYLNNIIKANELEKGIKVINENFDMLKNYSDFYFVCGIFFTELVSSNPEKYMCYFDNIELSYLNALELGESKNYDSVEGTGSYLAAFNLGLLYECTNKFDEAIKYYKLSAKYNYKRALERVYLLQHKID